MHADQMGQLDQEEVLALLERPEDQDLLELLDQQEEGELVEREEMEEDKEPQDGPACRDPRVDRV